MEIIEFKTPTVKEKGQVIARTQHSAQQFSARLGNGVSLEMAASPAGAY